MEMRTCRCCLSPGIHKDLNTSYLWQNNPEIYSEMLKECFNITLKVSDHTSSTICEDCIRLVRQSCSFKRKVIHNEQKLLSTLTDVQKIDQKPKGVKSEPPSDGGDDSDDYFLSNADQKPEVKLEKSLDERDDHSLSDSDEPKKRVKPTSSSKQLANSRILFDLGNLRKLVSAVIEHSTIMPFRWCSNKYMCFFCCCPFSSSRDLRQHTATEHENPTLKYVLQNVKNTSKVKLDVTDITCKKCGQKLNNLTEFFDHLVAKHEMNLKKEQSVHMTAFKLADDGMFCLECGQKFLLFGTLVGHTHRVHAKTETFLCEICGQAFPGKANVAKHVKAVHNIGNKNRCGKCYKSYSSETALSDHMRRMHRQERLKCPKCPEILRSAYIKKRHMALVHDVKHFQFSCDVCQKTFMFLNALAQHKARMHTKEKNFTCEICGFKVFNKDQLKRHMVKHDDSRPFHCEICKKSFQRKKTLDSHMRIHTNDKRYVCKECGKAFIQVTSLKLHSKVHHSALVSQN